MSNPSKRRGTAWESAIVAYLRDHGFPHAERRPLGGVNDRGDIAGIPRVVVECKSQKRHSWAEWLDEAVLEAANDNADLGIVWAHRRGHASPGEGYVVMDGRTLVWLLRSAGYGAPLEVDDE